jgi:hypothetical protein
MSAEADDRPTARSLAARLFEVLGRFRVTTVTAVVALAAASFALVFDLWPGLRPDPEVQLNATLTPLGLETKVWKSDFLQRTGEKRQPPGTPNRYGDLVFLQVETKGLKGYESQLRWYLYRAPQMTRLPAPQQPEDNVHLVSGTTSDRYVIPVWVQAPTEKGRYLVRFELTARGVLLAIADSPTFQYCRAKGCGA